MTMIILKSFFILLPFLSRSPSTHTGQPPTAMQKSRKKRRKQTSIIEEKLADVDSIAYYSMKGDRTT